MKKYNIILADPPWKYKVWKREMKEKRTAISHYDMMNFKDLKELKINKITKKDCALFLWVQSPMILNGLELIKSWGFNYKTIAFIWIKLNKKNKKPVTGMGHYTRTGAELCLLGIKGKLERQDKSVKQVLFNKLRGHSVKPIAVHKRIVKLFGDLPRIELFARKKVKGWSAWGNEIESDIKL